MTIVGRTTVNASDVAPQCHYTVSRTQSTYRQDATRTINTDVTYYTKETGYSDVSGADLGPKTYVNGYFSSYASTRLITYANGNSDWTFRTLKETVYTSEDRFLNTGRLTNRISSTEYVFSSTDGNASATVTTGTYYTFPVSNETNTFGLDYIDVYTDSITTYFAYDDTDTYGTDTTIPAYTVTTVQAGPVGSTYESSVTSIVSLSGFTTVDTSSYETFINDTTGYTSSSAAGSYNPAVEVQAYKVYHGNVGKLYVHNPLTGPYGSPVPKNIAFSYVTDDFIYANNSVGPYFTGLYSTDIGVGSVSPFDTFETTRPVYENTPTTLEYTDITSGSNQVQSTKGIFTTDSNGVNKLSSTTYNHTYTSTGTSSTTYEAQSFQQTGASAYTRSGVTVNYTATSQRVDSIINGTDATSVTFYSDSVISESSFLTGNTAEATIDTYLESTTVMSHKVMQGIVTLNFTSIDTNAGETTQQAFTASGYTGYNTPSYYAGTNMSSASPLSGNGFPGNGAAGQTYEASNAVIPSTDMSYNNSWGIGVDFPDTLSDYIGFGYSEVFDQIYMPTVYVISSATTLQTLDSVYLTTESDTSTGTTSFSINTYETGGYTYLSNLYKSSGSGIYYIANPFVAGGSVTVTFNGITPATTFDSTGGNSSAFTYTNESATAQLQNGACLVVQQSTSENYYIHSTYFISPDNVFPSEKRYVVL